MKGRKESDCPHGIPKWKCWTCSPPSHEELWNDFLDQYPNQRKVILESQQCPLKTGRSC